MLENYLPIAIFIVVGLGLGAVMILVGLIMMIVGVATPGDKPAD